MFAGLLAIINVEAPFIGTFILVFFGVGSAVLMGAEIGFHGIALAFGLSGYLLNATGFDVEMGGAQTATTFFWMRIVDVVIPAIAAALAIWAVANFRITEEKSAEIREKLDERRLQAAAESVAL